MQAKKITVISGGFMLLTVIVGFTVNQSHNNVVTVQTAKVVKLDISSVVSGSGEIRPKTFVNIGANAMGRITRLFVKEGDKVKKGQILARLDSTQSAADVRAMRAQVAGSKTDTLSADAALQTAIAQATSSKADLSRAGMDFERAQSLFKAQLIARQDYDAKKAAYQIAQAVAAQNDARVAQSRAQASSAEEHVAQNKAQLVRASDVFEKTVYTAPFDGIITNVPVHEGETVVMGIQNSPGSTLMTLADMSVTTAEVHVDETDIASVALHQQADVTIDAVAGKTFKGRVTEIGDNAIVRSSGVSSSQSATSAQEAKDFKVVITLDDPPPNLRPGLSATAKMTTGQAKSVVAIPIQALVLRDKEELQQDAEHNRHDSGAPNKEADSIQGVFVVTPGKRAEFRKVQTGLTGSAEIQIESGLNENEEIITGSYKVLKTLHNDAEVKVDNSQHAEPES